MNGITEEHQHWKTDRGIDGPAVHSHMTLKIPLVSPYLVMVWESVLAHYCCAFVAPAGPDALLAFKAGSDNSIALVMGIWTTPLA